MWLRIFLLVVFGQLSVKAVVISCEFRDTVNISSGFIDQHGHFNHNGVIYTKEYFAEFDYILDNAGNRIKTELHARGCICHYKSCIRVCCRQNSGIKGNCLKSDLLTLPLNDNEEKTIDLAANEFGMLEGVPCRKFYDIAEIEYDEDKWIFSNDKVNLLYENLTYDRHSYCFGHATGEDDNLITRVTICVEEHEEKSIGIRALLYTIGMIFSLPFLFFTLCVYGFIPELRNVHGKSLMCYVFSLIVMYTGWCIVHLEKSDAFYSGSFPCVFVGYMIYISVFACFFWLNVMCFDIWNTFRGGLKSRSNDKKKFLFYCLYAFGIPLLFTTTVFLFDILDFFSIEYQPQVGIKRCWIQDIKIVEALYVYIPISIIIAVNIAFYSITAIKIFKVQKETSAIRSGESQRHAKNDADKDRFFLYLRLFIIMGASWSMESISWVLNNRFYSFYISDFINCLQGFIIFILFVWKPKIRDLIRQRIRKMRKSQQMHPPKTVSLQTETTKASSSASNSNHDVRDNNIELVEKPMLS